MKNVKQQQDRLLKIMNQDNQSNSMANFDNQFTDGGTGANVSNVPVH